MLTRVGQMSCWATFVVAINTSALATEISAFSGNILEPGCREFAHLAYNEAITPSLRLAAGVCAGIAYSTFRSQVDVGGICANSDVTVQQSVRVLAKYLSVHPEHLNEPLDYLSILAFREAWPCSKN